MCLTPLSRTAFGSVAGVARNCREIRWPPARSSGERERGRPFFLWIHLSDADASCRTSHDRSSYDHGVASADAALGKLVAELRMRKLFEDSLMVIVADHGRVWARMARTVMDFFFMTRPSTSAL